MTAPTALIVVDLQKGTEDPSWGPRNNPSCEANVGALLEVWRSRGQPVVYIRHDSVEPGSTLRPGESGNDLHKVLGFDVRFVLDATYTHDRVTRDGELITADELARVTAVNLEPEFCRVVTTAGAIEELDALQPAAGGFGP